MSCEGALLDDFSLEMTGQDVPGLAGAEWISEFRRRQEGTAA